MRTFGWIIFLLLTLFSVTSQNLKPYVTGFTSTESMSIIKDKVVQNLEQNNINIIGQYQPANDANRWIIAISSEELVEAVKKVGGLTGFAAALRVAITKEEGKTIVSYTHPIYWGNAYFGEEFEKVSKYYASINNHLENTMKASGNFDGTLFGSEKGLSPEDLQNYRYMMGMPKFSSTVELEDFESYEEALSQLDAALKENVPNLKLVYKLSIPGKELTLYGFGLEGPQGEENFMPIIDINSPKHTAFLPYEVLVMGNEVHMLHGRYRIAIAFPDLTMGTFSKIMSTPGNIEDLMEQLVE